jgi:uncharacterized protein YbjQ (UPF0145 family)
MADFCCICKTKIGLLSEYGVLQPSNQQNRKLYCAKCKSQKLALNHTQGLDADNENRENAISYFEQYIQNGELEDIVKDCVNTWIVSSKEEIEKRREEEKNAILLVEKIDKYEANKGEYEKFVTTSFQFDGYEIQNYLGLVSGEVVMGTGFLSEFTAGVSDFFGATSDSFANKMELAKQGAEKRMLKNSIIKGGNAIIGVTFNYITFSNNMIAVSANGTSVVIRKRD